MRKHLTCTLRRAGLSVLTLGGVVLLAPSLASATKTTSPNPPCNTPLYASVTLHSNLNCSGAGDGLVIGEANITINLNGFKLTGSRKDSAGIDDSSGYSYVKVKDGTVSGFETDLKFYDVNRASINRVDAENAYLYGLDMEKSTKSVITDSQFSSDGVDGVLFQYNTNVALGFSKAGSDQYGIYDYDSHAAIYRMTLNHNRDDGLYVNDPVVLGGTDYLIVDSTANDNRYNGFEIADNTPPSRYQADLVGNTAANNGLWGYYAANQAAGRNNSAKNNGSGNCFNVPCQ